MNWFSAHYRAMRTAPHLYPDVRCLPYRFAAPRYQHAAPASPRSARMALPHRAPEGWMTNTGKRMSVCGGAAGPEPHRVAITLLPPHYLPRFIPLLGDTTALYRCRDDACCALPASFSLRSPHLAAWCIAGRRTRGRAGRGAGRPPCCLRY